MFIQIYNVSSFFIPKGASVLSMDISVPNFTVDCNGTVGRDGVFVRLSHYSMHLAVLDSSGTLFSKVF